MLFALFFIGLGLLLKIWATIKYNLNFLKVKTKALFQFSI